MDHGKLNFDLGPFPTVPGAVEPLTPGKFARVLDAGGPGVLVLARGLIRSADDAPPLPAG